MSDLVLDASLALQWFLEDEADRKYSLGVLASLSERRAFVPLLWFYEIGNGLVMAGRRKRITPDQIDGFLIRLRALHANVGVIIASNWTVLVFQSGNSLRLARLAACFPEHSFIQRQGNRITPFIAPSC